ncbi:MAG TPA: polysaccharide biosynthesis tyrosine autokinase [Polyangia bacterium]|jgi:capsular exopolysaccharide synthesis family protein|nr:polysaccharide biosynthesis tyrosine autokinase [Polyangia bacterium]
MPDVLDANKIDFRSYWRVVRKRWPIIALAALLGVGAAFIWTYRQPKIYEATCQIVIETMAPQVLKDVKDVVELGTGSYWANKEFYETQYRIIQSTAVMRGVVERLGLQNDPAYAGVPGNKPDPVEIARRLLRQVEVKPVKDSRLAQIIVSDQKPERAVAIANTLADTYIEHNLSYKLEGARTATAWLTEQSADLRKKLEESELSLYEFRRSRNLLAISLDEKVSMTSQNLSQLNVRLSELRVKRLELESTRKLILAARNDMNEKESVPEIQKDTLIQSIRQGYVHLSKEKGDLASRYGDDHPRIKAVQGQLDEMRRQWERAIDQVLTSFEKGYRAVVDTQVALEKMMENEKKEAIELSKLDLEYKPLGRKAEENAKFYGLIASRQKEIDLTGVMKANNVRVLERAVLPGGPVSPKPMQNLGIGLLVGLAAGLGLGLLIEALDNTLKTQASVESLLGVPVLGLIPIIGGKQEDKDEPEALRERDLGVYLDPRSLAAECCRSIRTNILFMSPDHPLRTLVVTSPSPQEGKTTTAVNLAVTMAETGGRVLLIDTDLRRPRLHRSFGVPNQVGISTVIVGKSTLDEAIKSTDVPNLDVLPCGPTPPNPSELLHTGRFAQVLAECASRYERVILDSPPCSAVTDPAVLGNVADGVLLVVQAGSTTRDAAAHARRHLASAKARLLGVILNEIDFSNPAYGYQYYYYQNYARYGYGTQPEENKA